MPLLHLAQQTYAALPLPIQREVDRLSLAMQHIPDDRRDEAARAAATALEGIPSDIRAEPHRFGVECVQLVLTTVALALLCPGLSSSVGPDIAAG